MYICIQYLAYEYIYIYINIRIYIYTHIYIYLNKYIYIYTYIHPRTLCPAVTKIVIRLVRNLLLVRTKRVFVFSFSIEKCAFWPAATSEFEHVHFGWQVQCFVTLHKLFVAFSLAGAQNRVFLDGPYFFGGGGVRVGWGAGAIVAFLPCRLMMLRSWLSSLDVNRSMMLRFWLSSANVYTSMMLRSWLSSLDVNTSMMLRFWLSSANVYTSMMLRSWLSSLDVNTSMMLRFWLSSANVYTSMMLRSWLSSLDVNTSMMLRSWLSSLL